MSEKSSKKISGSVSGERRKVQISEYIRDCVAPQHNLIHISISPDKATNGYLYHGNDDDHYYVMVGTEEKETLISFLGQKVDNSEWVYIGDDEGIARKMYDELSNFNDKIYDSLDIEVGLYTLPEDCGSTELNKVINDMDEIIQKEIDEKKPIKKIVVRNKRIRVEEEESEKDESDEEIEIRKANEVKERRAKLLKNYDIKKKWYLDDFLAVYGGKMFDSYEEAVEKITVGMSKVLVKVRIGKSFYIIKEEDNPFQFFDGDLKRKHPSKFRVKGKDYEKTGKYKEYKIMDIADHDLASSTGKIVDIPYIGVKPETRHFNMFTGFRAKMVNKVDMELIKPILDHIREVIADGNEHLYKYYLSWLSYPFRQIRGEKPESKTGVCVVLLGKQGCGKSIIANAIAEMIYGMKLSHVGDSIRAIADKFNGHLIGKYYTVVNEVASGDGTSKWISYFETLKTRITEKHVSIEKKGKDAFTIENNNNITICTNNNDSIKQEDDDRRFAVFKCSDSYIGDYEYFKTLANCLNDQEIMNHFFTYLIGLSVSDTVDLQPVPKVHKLSSGTTTTFIESFEEGLITFNPENDKFLKYSDKCDDYTCKLDDLYNLYRDHCKESNKSIKTKIAFSRSKDINDVFKVRVVSGYRMRIIPNKYIEG